MATQTRREQHRATFTRGKRRSLYWLVVAGLMLTSLNLLACVAYIFVTVVLHESPF